MSQSIELVPFYSAVLTYIQELYRDQIIDKEQRSLLKDLVVSSDGSMIQPLYDAYQEGTLEDYILIQILKLPLEENSQYSLSVIEDQKSTLSCMEERNLKPMKMLYDKKMSVRKRSNSMSDIKEK